MTNSFSVQLKVLDSGDWLAIKRSRVFLLPFPGLGATVPLGVHLVLEDCGHAVQPRPFLRRSLIVHGTPITHAAILLHCADALAYPRGHVSLFAHDDSLALAVQRPTRPNNRPVGTPICGFCT